MGNAPPARPRVLVVDDTALNRALIAGLLGDSGVEVDEAGDGQAAVERFAGGRYDLVLLDLQMPVMDGLQAAREMRSLEHSRGLPPTPLIAISANTDAAQLTAARAAGCNDLLARPLKRETLLALLGDANADATPAAEAELDPVLRPLLPRLFLQLDTCQAALQQSCADGDADGLRRAAHAGRGNAQMFGAHEVDRLLGEIEQRAAGGHCDTERLPPLAAAIAELRTRLGDS